MTAPLSSAMTGPETTAAEQSRLELAAKLNGLGGLGGRQISPEARAKKLREACEGFESIFIQKMWQEMRNTVPKGGLLHGKEERFWQDMYDQELSKSMTAAGGIGLADMMYEQLSRNLVSASRSAASSVTGAAFTPSAAPLVVEDAPQDLIGGKLQASADAIYEAPAEPGALPGQGKAGQPAQAQPEAERGALPPLTTQPAQVRYSPAANTAHDPAEARKRVADLGQSQGLALAQKARRDAGDKLGSRAVRPPQPGQKIRAARERQEIAPMPAVAANIPGGISQAGLAPGSPEALKAAVELAKTGAAEMGAPQENTQAAAINLHNLVADVQARNAREALAANAAAQEVAEAGPTMRRVRKTTNIPQRGRSKTPPKQSDAIRMLNVDNVGVNSKAGQGLKAYQAQRDAALQASQEIEAGQGGEQAIPPLRATGQATQAEAQAGNFAIPPLRAADARG